MIQWVMQRRKIGGNANAVLASKDRVPLGGDESKKALPSVTPDEGTNAKEATSGGVDTIKEEEGETPWGKGTQKEPLRENKSEPRVDGIESEPGHQDQDLDPDPNPDPEEDQKTPNDIAEGDSSAEASDQEAEKASHYPVGTIFFKHFQHYGDFQGRIVDIRPQANNGRIYRVKYTDGDLEDLTKADVLESCVIVEIPSTNGNQARSRGPKRAIHWIPEEDVFKSPKRGTKGLFNSTIRPTVGETDLPTDMETSGTKSSQIRATREERESFLKANPDIMKDKCGYVGARGPCMRKLSACPYHNNTPGRQALVIKQRELGVPSEKATSEKKAKEKLPKAKAPKPDKSTPNSLEKNQDQDSNEKGVSTSKRKKVMSNGESGKKASTEKKTEKGRENAEREKHDDKALDNQDTQDTQDDQDNQDTQDNQEVKEVKEAKGKAAKKKPKKPVKLIKLEPNQDGEDSDPENKEMLFGEFSGPGMTAGHMFNQTIGDAFTARATLNGYVPAFGGMASHPEYMYQGGIVVGPGMHGNANYMQMQMHMQGMEGAGGVFAPTPYHMAGMDPSFAEAYHSRYHQAQCHPNAMNAMAQGMPVSGMQPPYGHPSYPYYPHHVNPDNS